MNGKDFHPKITQLVNYKSTSFSDATYQDGYHLNLYNRPLTASSFILLNAFWSLEFEMFCI